jgi:hypothetical protein
MISKKLLIVAVMFLVALSGLAVGLSCSDGGEMSEVSIEGYGEVIDSDGNWVGEPIVGLQGPQGPQGEQGHTGDTGPQGEQGLQGPQGEPGLPGTGVAWQGEWSDAITYSLDDAVGYEGSSYVSKQDGNTNHLPTDTAWWDLWVAKGDTGDTGPQGPEGLQGLKGDTGDTGPQGLQGIQGEPGPNMIVATGMVWETGAIQGHYNVSSCVWDPAGKEYEIVLDGINFIYFSYVTLVTIADSGSARTAEVMSTAGMLLVRIYDLDGNRVQEHFYFMVLDPSP